MKNPDLFTRGGFRYRNWIPAKVEPAVRIASPTWLAVERPFPRKSKIRVAALSSAGCGVCGNHRRGAGATPWDPWDCDATVSADYSVDWIDRWSSRRFPRWPGSGRGRKRRHWPPWKKPIPLHTIRPCSIQSSFIQLKIIYKIPKKIPEDGISDGRGERSVLGGRKRLRISGDLHRHGRRGWRFGCGDAAQKVVLDVFGASLPGQTDGHHCAQSDDDDEDDDGGCGRIHFAHGAVGDGGPSLRTAPFCNRPMKFKWNVVDLTSRVTSGKVDVRSSHGQRSRSEAD